MTAMTLTNHESLTSSFLDHKNEMKDVSFVGPNETQLSYR